MNQDSVRAESNVAHERGLLLGLASPLASGS